MMKNNTSLGAYLLLYFLLAFQLLNAQQVGDFRSKATGNWINPGTWEKCTSISPETWTTSTTSYPGESEGSYAVTILDCHTVSTPLSTSTFKIGDLIVSGVLMINGRLDLDTTNKLWIKGGSMVWAGNIGVYLPNNAALIITGPKLCANSYILGLSSTAANTCNSHTALFIGTVKYTSCVGRGNGNAAAGDFDDVNGSGGSLLSSPGAYPSALCLGSAIQPTLSGNVVQYGVNFGAITYAWSLVSKPSGSTLTFTPTTVRNLVLPVLTVAGDYVFKLVTSISIPISFSNEQTVTITVGGETVYSGGGVWSFDAPSTTNQRIAKINSDYSTGTSGSFYACSCEVAANKTLTIAANTDVTLLGELINKGNVTIESDANLIQITETAVNIGDITVLRNSPMKKNNYTYWSSPVSGRQLEAFSPLTATARFYEYIESTNLFKTVPKTGHFIPTKGYAIMAPSTYTSTTVNTIFEGKFVGVPTNGTQFKTGAVTTALEFPLALSAGLDQGYNLVGNPYPSNIDFEVLHSLNSNKIHNTAYFWTNVDPNRPGSTNGTGNSYSGNAYAIYNGTGGVPATGTGGTSATPTQYIKVGQGFIVKSKVDNQSLVFNNSIRNSTGSSTFFSKVAASGRDRFWLHLTTPALNVNTILIGYIANASNDFEWDYDAPLFSVASDSFYSLLNDDKLGIQGRTYPLDRKDVVTLGTKHFEVGTYTISLGDKEGIFANGQNIYLTDLQTGIITNLTQGSYAFSANAGESTGRFEIVYEPGAVLTTDAIGKEELIVYRDGEDFVVSAKSKKITDLEVYDASGRLVYKTQPNDTKVIISSDRLNNGMYLLKINQNGNITGKKILK